MDALDRFGWTHPKAAIAALGIGSLGSLRRALDERLAGALPRAGDFDSLVAAIICVSTLCAQNWRESFLYALAEEARVTSERRLHAGTPRSVWGLTPIINIIPCSRADRMLGTDAETLTYDVYRITHEFDVVLSNQRRLITEQRPDLMEAFEWMVLVWALLRYDVFHLFNDRGFLTPDRDYGYREEELRLYRAAGLRLYLYAFGADFRTRDRTLAMGPVNGCMDCPQPGTYCICSEDAASDVLRLHGRYATGVVSMADGHRYLPGALQTFYWPVDTGRIEVQSQHERAGPLRVAHAPNHTHFKGTRYLEQAVATLVQEGLPIELDLVTGVSNLEVMARFRAADVIVDQLIIGFHGYTAIEAMALGKPVICYLRAPNEILAPQECPLINADPHTIQDVLRDLARRPGRLVDIGERSRRYAEHYYSIPAFAGRLAGLYRETSGFPLSLLRRIEAVIAPNTVSTNGVSSQ